MSEIWIVTTPEQADFRKEYPRFTTAWAAAARIMHHVQNVYVECAYSSSKDRPFIRYIIAKENL